MAISITINTQPVSQLIDNGLPVTLQVVASCSDNTKTLLYQWLKDGRAILGATTDTLYFAAIAPEDSNVYSCLVTCGAPGVETYSDLACIALSVLDYIELNMKIAILGIKVADGYNYDWQLVNEEDEAYINQQTQLGYPRAIIESSITDNKDDPNGPNAGAYTNEAQFTIWAKSPQASSTLNPNFTVRSNLRLAEMDLLKLFGSNISVNGSCTEILYRGGQIFLTSRNDVTNPASVRTRWLVRYTIDRTNPIQYASS
jgi:hypothetical protein